MSAALDDPSNREWSDDPSNREWSDDPPDEREISSFLQKHDLSLDLLVREISAALDASDSKHVVNCLVEEYRFQTKKEASLRALRAGAGPQDANTTGAVRVGTGRVGYDD